MGPKWLVPGVEGILLLGLVLRTPTRHHNRSPQLRAFAVGLIGLVSLTTLISLILLARYLVDGSHACRLHRGARRLTQERAAR
jgi:hypothetical protein